jgi:hypothetical protein
MRDELDELASTVRSSIPRLADRCGAVRPFCLQSRLPSHLPQLLISGLRRAGLRLRDSRGAESGFHVPTSAARAVQQSTRSSAVCPCRCQHRGEQSTPAAVAAKLEQLFAHLCLASLIGCAPAACHPTSRAQLMASMAPPSAGAARNCVLALARASARKRLEDLRARSRHAQGPWMLPCMAAAAAWGEPPSSVSELSGGQARR